MEAWKLIRIFTPIWDREKKLKIKSLGARRRENWFKFHPDLRVWKLIEN